MPTNTERMELRRKRMADSPAFLRGGFRTFFLGVALWAILALAVWLAFLFGVAPDTLVDDPLAWHRHEMLFGFVGAAIAGFALTAVPNWTGGLPIAGTPLATLFGIWVAGRILPFVSSNEDIVLLMVDGGFYILLSVLLGRKILERHNRNLPVVIVIALFGLADLLDRAAMGSLIEIGSSGWRIGMTLVVFLLSLIGGRIVPSFTRNWLAPRGAKEPLPTQPGRLDKLVLVLTFVALSLWLIAPSSLAAGAAMILAAIGHLMRLMEVVGLEMLPGCSRGRSSTGLSLVANRASPPWASPVRAVFRILRHPCIVDRRDGNDDPCRYEPRQSGSYRAGPRGKPNDYRLVCSNNPIGHRTSRRRFPIAEQQAILAVAGVGWFGAFGLFLLQYVPILCSARLDRAQGG